MKNFLALLICSAVIISLYGERMSSDLNQNSDILIFVSPLGDNDMNTWTNIKPAKENISVKFPAKEGVWKLTVVIEGKNGDQVGLGGIVST